MQTFEEDVALLQSLRGDLDGNRLKIGLLVNDRLETKRYNRGTMLKLAAASGIPHKTLYEYKAVAVFIRALCQLERFNGDVEQFFDRYREISYSHVRCILPRRKYGWEFEDGVDALMSINERTEDSIDPDFAQYFNILPMSPARFKQYVSAKQRKGHESLHSQLGKPISFRGLQYAPINEQGVVLLFGMICRDLGFAIEAVQQGYPDCIAVHYPSSQSERGKRVRIEFEYRSKNFDHNPVGCDLIVCWIHDWVECPLEVLELRSQIKSLRNF